MSTLKTLDVEENLRPKGPFSFGCFKKSWSTFDKFGFANQLMTLQCFAEFVFYEITSEGLAKASPRFLFSHIKNANGWKINIFCSLFHIPHFNFTQLRKQTSVLFLSGDFVEEIFVNVARSFLCHSTKKFCEPKKRYKIVYLLKRWSSFFHMLQDSRFSYLLLPLKHEKSNHTENCLWTSSALDTRQSQ